MPLKPLKYGKFNITIGQWRSGFLGIKGAENLAKMVPYVEEGAKRAPYIDGLIQTGVSAYKGEDYLRTATGAAGGIAGASAGYSVGAVLTDFALQRIVIGLAVVLLPIEIPGVVVAGIVMIGALVGTYFGGKKGTEYAILFFDDLHLEKVTKPIEEEISKINDLLAKEIKENPQMLQMSPMGYIPAAHYDNN